MKATEYLEDPRTNKGTAFTQEERSQLGLQGLLPPVIEGIEQQMKRVENHLNLKATDLDKYIYLIELLDRNETLFYKVLMSDPERFIPIMYTPTIGEACLKFSDIYRRNNGMYITIRDRGNVKQLLSHWPEKEVRFICVSTGGRILGLGDLGANGMGIPLGKLQLYTACAGVPPAKLLPLLLDCGTDNQKLLNDPLYLGIRQNRPATDELDSFVQEFVEAVQELFPDCCIHFEDWKGTDAIRLLARYRDKVCCYNDDIQGTAGVALAGLIGALNITGEKLGDQNILMFGAGSASIGIANMIVSAMRLEGLTLADARKRISMFDTKGLIIESRSDLSYEKRNYAHEGKATKNLVDAVSEVKPSVLIGVSTIGKAFSMEVVGTMSRLNKRPIIFALSNPTEHAECTAEEAYQWSEGRAIYASGVPFDDVKIDDKIFTPGQANNFYLFPGVSLGIYAAKPKFIKDEMWIEGAKTLAGLVTPEQRERGMVFPPQSDILSISTKVAEHVVEIAFESGLAERNSLMTIPELIGSLQYKPIYPTLRENPGK